MQVQSKFVWGCLEVLIELDSQNRLTLTWIPGHRGYKFNEEAYLQAREQFKVYF